jgi:outer membrane protein TolC
MGKWYVFIGLAVLLGGTSSGFAGQATTQGGGRLSDLVAALEGINPEMEAARHEIEVRAKRVGPAGAPPDPIVASEITNVDAFREVSVSQEFPFPGKLSLRTKVATADTEVMRFAADEVRLERIAELKSMYMEYRLGDRSLAIVRRNRTRLQQMTRVTEARFSVGQGAQQDVVKAQLELTLLTERETALERQQAALRARINKLLVRPPQEPLDPGLTFDVQPLAHDVPELLRLAEANYPAIKRDDEAIRRDELMVALARKEVWPDFGAKLTFEKDPFGLSWMYGVEVMANVPIFANRKQKQLAASAESAVAVSRSVQRATVAAAAGRIGDQIAVVTSTRRLIRLYEDSVLPQARLALDASLAAYETGSVDFLTLLTNFTTILNYELALEEQQTTLFRALADLEPVTGQVLLQ